MVRAARPEHTAQIVVWDILLFFSFGVSSMLVAVLNFSATRNGTPPGRGSIAFVRVVEYQGELIGGQLAPTSSPPTYLTTSSMMLE